MCLCHTIKIQKNSEPNSKKENLNTATEEERSRKKRRFADVETEELDSIVENAQFFFLHNKFFIERN